MASVGTTSASVRDALNRLPNSYASKILMDVIVDTPFTSSVAITEAVTTPISITGAFTTGISIAADGTTAMQVTSAFTGTTGLLLAGTGTNGISITGVHASGISITGAMTTAGILIQYTLPAQPDHAIEVITTSASTTGGSSVRPIHMVHTSTGIGGVGHRAEFEHTTNVALGGWANAIKGQMTFGAAGSVSGLASAVNCEMTVPNQTVPSGFYAPLEIELNIPASHVPQANQLAMMYMSPNTTPATFDTYGTIFELAGVSVGAGKVFDTCTAAAASHALRITIAGTYYYIMLNSNVDA